MLNFNEILLFFFYFYRSIWSCLSHNSMITSLFLCLILRIDIVYLGVDLLRNPKNTEINLLCLWSFPIFCELRVPYILELIFYWSCCSSDPNKVFKVAYILLTWKYFLKKMQWAIIMRRKEVIYFGYINLIKITVGAHKRVQIFL